MPSTRRVFLYGLAAAGAVAASGCTAGRHEFRSGDAVFLLDGQPFQIRSGSIHYPRIPRAYWRDRMRQARAMGLNAISTYCFWDLHEPRPGQFDFTGNLDVAAFVRTAQAEGLWVLLRPGPYVCSEWDWGGLPAWLLRSPTVRVRTRDPRFLAASGRYLRRLVRELGTLQTTRGGPILMAQVENEYGSFGKDHAYMRAMRKLFRQAGFEVQLCTADGADEIPNGSLPDTIVGIDFGAGSAAPEFAKLLRQRPRNPRFCSEFWTGWFDHWGGPHHTVPAAVNARDVEWMMARGYSFNLYMFVGGTSFGYRPGANSSHERPYQPDVNSYDYDAPVSEAGDLTPKFTALHKAIVRHLPSGTQLPPPPAPARRMALARFALGEAAPWTAALAGARPVRSTSPTCMEDLGQCFGYVLYRLAQPPAGRGALAIPGLRDYATVVQGGRRLGTLDRRAGRFSLALDLVAAEPLDILVENMGRINFGQELSDGRAGIVGPVTWDGQELRGWEQYSLPWLSPPRNLPWAPAAAPAGATCGQPTFYRGACQVDQPADTFLDLRGWGKGQVWVNGRHLGRFWHIGPQQTLYLPAPWLGSGANEFVVLELEPSGRNSLAGATSPLYARAPAPGAAARRHS
ncbi:MAG: glycoside hydrolase family 35 protein [Terriglobales bacterium]